jgi:acetolactate synthase-1/2/3 large subunit
MINRAKRPLIISGGGVISSDSTDELNIFVKKRNIPVVNTLMGYGTDTGKESLSLGGLGMHGTLYGNYAVLNCDLLIALGTRFSDRILGDAEKFAPKAKTIHIDIDPAEIGKNKYANLSIVGSLKNVLREFNKANVSGDYSDWVEDLEEYKLNNPMTFKFKGKLKPQFVIKEVNKVFPEDTIVVTDVGQNQMWVPQFYKFVKPRCHLTSGGLGTMGYALPSAIGAKVGNPEREVLMFAGDGGFQMNIQELVTVRKYGLNIKMIILDNAYLGMVRQWQQLICDSRYCMTCLDDNPDFVAVAKAFGIKAKRVDTIEEFKNSIVELRESREAMILHTIIEREENVLPMVPAGKPLNEYITEIKKKTV